MMKSIRVILINSGLLTILLGLFLLSFKTGEEWPGKKNLEKVDKEVGHIWDNDSLTITEIKDLKTQFFDSYKKVYNIQHKDKKIGFAYLGRVNTCRPGGCSSPYGNSSGTRSFEFFEYYMILDSNYAVKHVEILNYNATHGYEIASKNWLKQFLGYQGNQQMDYGTDIQAISGATISANSITKDIRKVVDQLKNINFTQNR